VIDTDTDADMSYQYGDYRRVDYSSPPGTQNQPIEIAMGLFVNWAKRNDRNYVSDLVKENLQRELDQGATPKQAFDRYMARVR
jgi:hypothetical protein